MFLPEQPYFVPGRLRDQFLTGDVEGTTSDEEVLGVLRTLHLETAIEQLGGLDATHDWGTVLSLAEQQLLSFARLCS